ncbi:MAG: hypothetical protein PF484_02805 [Bacteroidales bacterium]|jgi:hypothetical protein|nr:hypothetical protein [Bacteroidales bacterium]
MKKIISLFVLVGLFAFVAPTVANACGTFNFKCADGTAVGVVVICDFQDYMAWQEILCGVEPL